jgi:hypothetical protein
VKLARFRKFSLLCGIIDLIKYKQYYEKQGTLTGDHIQERDGKRRKLRR